MGFEIYSISVEFWNLIRIWIRISVFFFIFFLLFHEFKHCFFLSFCLFCSFLFSLSVFIGIGGIHDVIISCGYKFQFMRWFRHQCLELDLRNNFSLLKRFKVENRVIIASCCFYYYYCFRTFHGVFRFIYSRVECAKKKNLVLSLFLCFLCFFFIGQMAISCIIQNNNYYYSIFFILNAPKPF